MRNASSSLHGKSSGSPVNENLAENNRREKALGAISSRSKSLLWETNGEEDGKKERWKERSKNCWFEQKSRFGTLHCVRNMKMELGRMTESFHCPASKRSSQGQMVGFSFADFSIPRWTTSSRFSPPHLWQTYFCEIFLSGARYCHLHHEWLYRDERDTWRSVRSNNVTQKSRDAAFFTWWELYFLAVITREDDSFADARELRRANLARGINSRRW